jgi:hypothetical protein
MDERTVGDVIGAPESWPNFPHVRKREIPDMRGAVISMVSESDDGIAVSTIGSACGDTYAVFAIADRALRERTTRALTVGQKVHDAVRLPLQP